MPLKLTNDGMRKGQKGGNAISVAMTAKMFFVQFLTSWKHVETIQKLEQETFTNGFLKGRRCCLKAEHNCFCLQNLGLALPLSTTYR